MRGKVRLLNTDIDNISMEELLASLNVGTILTVHSDMLMRLQRYRDFYEISKKCDYVTCDSQILLLACRFLGTPLKERVSGSDFLPKFYMYHKHNEEIRIFLLGGMGTVAAVAHERINTKVGRQIVVGSYSPPIGFEHDDWECDRIVEMVNDSRATVLVVGFGAPKQERFIFKHRNRMPHVKILLPLGGALDYEAEELRRPPRWITNAGLEWLYRLMAQPRQRWRRYLVDDLPVFYLLVKQRLGLYRNPFADRAGSAT